MQLTQGLKAYPVLELKSIERRANCKMVQFEGRSFLVGGMTADAISNQVFELRLNHQFSPARLEWKEVHFDNNLFSPRNSFSVCAARGNIYVWGGLELDQSNQKALSDLIQMDVSTGRMRAIPLKEPLKIHSTALFFDEDQQEFIAYGGSDQDTNTPAYLYRLPFAQTQTEYEWQKQTVKFAPHQGYVWQHSGHLTKRSLFSGQEGSFLTVVGGCRFPQSPYKTILEINTQTGEATNSAEMETGLVSHDSVVREGVLFIFGGSNGGDFNTNLFILDKGKVLKLNGHRAIGCCCCLLEGRKMLVYGGVCGEASINGAFIYE